MYRKNIYIIFLFFIFLYDKQAIALEKPQSVEDIVIMLKTVSPSTPKGKVLECLGDSHLSENNVLSWHWKENDITKSIIVNVDNDVVVSSAYFEFYNGNDMKREEFFAKYDFFQANLSDFLGTPIQEALNLTTLWPLEKDLLFLINVSDAEGNVGIGILIKNKK